jgi:hypothetical protein
MTDGFPFAHERNGVREILAQPEHLVHMRQGRFGGGT